MRSWNDESQYGRASERPGRDRTSERYGKSHGPSSTLQIPGSRLELGSWILELISGLEARFDDCVANRGRKGGRRNDRRAQDASKTIGIDRLDFDQPFGERFHRGALPL